MVIVGLGNIGPNFENTRHNIGFYIIDELFKNLKSKIPIPSHPDWKILSVPKLKFILIKPQTFMNNSGQYLLQLSRQFGFSAKDLLIIYDDISLPLGKFLYKNQSSSGGHNGMANVIETFRTDKIKRLKIGIGRNKNFPLQEWVLGQFSFLEQQQIEQLTPVIIQSLNELLEGKFTFLQVMNFYNCFSRGLQKA